MDVTLNQTTLNESAILTLLAADIAGASRLRLFKVPFNPTADNVLADYVASECDFDGYAAKPAGPAVGPALQADGNYVLETLTAHFTQTGIVVTNSVNGAFLVDEAGTGVIAWAVFAGPVQMNLAGRFLDVKFEILANGSGDCQYNT